MTKPSAKTTTSAVKRKPAASGTKNKTASLKKNSEHVAKQQAVNKPVSVLPKKDQLITLLQSPNGCTIDEMTTVTGWQAHTVRGVISGVLRKKLGLHVTYQHTDSGNRYKILPISAS